MTSPAGGAAGGPVAQAGRIDSIDVLRGFALLGILVMNIQLFAMPEAAYYNPTAYGDDLEGANLYVWFGGRLLADQKFMTIGTVTVAVASAVFAGLQASLPSWPHGALQAERLQRPAFAALLRRARRRGPGRRHYGSVDRLEQLGIVIGVWTVQLLASPLWLRRFRFGPAEWVWRSLTYGTRPPFRA